MKKGPVFIILIILVILVIGGFLLFRSPSTEKESDKSEETTTTTLKTSSTTVTTNKPNNNTNTDFDSSNFSTDTQQAGDEDAEDAIITDVKSISNDDYISIEWTFESDSIPSSQAELLEGSNVIKVTINNLEEDNSGLSFGENLSVEDSVVSSVIRDIISGTGRSEYSVGIKQTTSFYLRTSSNKLILDVQEQEIEGQTDNYDNEFSKDQQEITSEVEGDVIWIDRLSFSNQGDVYKIVLDLGSSSSVVVPNVSADLLTSGPSNYEVRLVVENLYSDYIAGASGYSQDLTDDIVTKIAGNYSNNQSIYSVTLSKEAEYRIYATSSPAQLIIEVKRN